MGPKSVLAAIRYPLKRRTIATIECAIEIARGHRRAHLYVLHVNVIHRGERVTRELLRRAVEGEFGVLENASYHVRDSFLLEEAILAEVANQDVDCVVIGRDRKARWRQVLADVLDLDVNLETFLADHLDAELVVV